MKSYNQDNYSFLIAQLDRFVRKYYQNQLIRGSIYALGGLVLVYLCVTVLEYFGHFSSNIRATLFFSYAAFTLYTLVRFVAIPLAHLLHIGKVINYEQAASIIGQFFPEVQDKLLNILQLKQGAGNSSSRELIEASINQKISVIKPVPFTRAIDLKANLRYARYAVLPLLALICILFISPGMITDSSERLMNYNKYYAPKAPFQLQVENKKLQATQQEDFELNVSAAGKLLPDEVFIEVNGTLFKLQKKDKTSFSYLFRNLQRDVPFRLFADEFYTDYYTLDVLARPHILNFSVDLNYPAYLGRKNETLTNSGDMTIPAGTQVTWHFNTRNVSSLSIGLGTDQVNATPADEKQFSLHKRILHSTPYVIHTANNETSKGDSIPYTITVIPDAYPSILVETHADSLSFKTVYFSGDIEDDHGFRKLQFVYALAKKEGVAVTDPQKTTVNIPLGNSFQKQHFYHVFDMSSLNIQPGDELEYYFEVWDNDGVTGSKAARTHTELWKLPGKTELKEQAENNSKQLKNQMNEAIREAKNLQREMKELEEKMTDKRELSWEEKKKLEDLIKREHELEKKINDMKQQNEQNMQQQQQFSETDQQIMQKQQELQKIWDEVLSEDLKKMLQQMEKMMQQSNKDQLQQQLEKMEMNNKDVEKELDRMLELYKRLEMEQKLKENADALQKLAEKQEKLAEETKEKKKDAESKEQLKQKQENIKKDFEQIKKDLQDIEKKNQQLEQPSELPDTKKEQEQIQQDLNNSKEQMEKENQKKASESQKDAADKMKEMAEKMEQAMNQASRKQQEEDYESLRGLLENLIQLSKDQEDLMQQMAQVQGYNPQFVKMGQKQKELKDNARIIEDSLYALSKRVQQIQSFINRELGEVNFNMDKALKAFADRNIGEGRGRQQYVMTSVNNIAVLLSEVLKQMQNENNNSSKSGNGSCNKPGKGKNSKPGGKSGQSLGELLKMQEQLNEMMKNGQKPGGKDGQGMGQGMGSKQFAEMAAKQAAIRRQIQKMQQQLQKEGNGGLGNQLQQIQQLMEQTEKELVNKQYNRQMLERQEEIKTRMLESEKAEKERETENKRESKTAGEKPRTLPPDMEQYLKQKNREQELLLTIPPTLQPFYRDKSREYFNRIGTQ